MPVDPEHEKDEPPELVQSDSEDDDERMVYSLTDPSESKRPSSDSEKEAVVEFVLKRARMSANAFRRSPQPRCASHFSGQQQPLPESGRRSAEEELRSFLASTKVR